MLFQLLVCSLLALFASHFAVQAEPRFRPPKPKDPDPPSPVRPINPNNPKPITPGDLTNPNPVPDPVVMQSNMGRLEQELKKVDIGLGVDIAKEVVGAILGTGSRNTGTLYPTSVTALASDVTLTPTATVPMSSFRACQSFARALDSCASATTSFYSMTFTSQASCACYSRAYAQTISCATSTGIQMAAVPTLDANGFDDNANGCWNFLHDMGYRKIASVLLNSETMPGALFCANVDTVLKERSGKNGTHPEGLKKSLQATPTGSCMRPPTSGQVSGKTRIVVARLTAFDRGVLVAYGIVVASFSWLVVS